MKTARIDNPPSFGLNISYPLTKELAQEGSKVGKRVSKAIPDKVMNLKNVISDSFEVIETKTTKEGKELFGLALRKGDGQVPLTRSVKDKKNLVFEFLGLVPNQLKDASKKLDAII